MQYPAKQESESNIQLGRHTLEFLSKMVVNKCDVSNVDIRSTAASIWNFQQRWATPIELPFGFGNDFDKPIEIAVPYDELINLGLLYEWNLQPQQEGDGVVKHNKTNKFYCLAGSAAWKQLVDNKTITDSVHATAPTVTFANFLKDLFQMFLRSKGTPLESDARKLAACWYYHASEMDFNEEEDDDDMEDSEAKKNDVQPAKDMPFMRVINNIPGGAEEFIGDKYEEDQDEDFNEAENAEDDDDDEYEDDGDIEIPNDVDSKQEANEEDDEDFAMEDDEDDDDEEEGAMNGGGLGALLGGNSAAGGGLFSALTGGALSALLSGALDSKVHEETEAQKKVRENILQAVQSLNAYFPAPTHDPVHFHRMRVKMTTDTDRKWFPWGTLPIVELTKCSTANDAQLRDFANDVLHVLAPKSVQT